MLTLIVISTLSLPSVGAQTYGQQWDVTLRLGGGTSSPNTAAADRLSGAGRRAIDLTVGITALEVGPTLFDVETQLVHSLPNDDDLELTLREVRLRGLVRWPGLFWAPLSAYGGLGATGAWMRVSADTTESRANEFVPGGLAFIGLRFENGRSKRRSFFVYGEYGYALRAERILRLQPEDAEPVPLGRVDFSGHVISAGVGMRF